MRTVSISYFKAHCLRLVDEVSKSGLELLITKRGRPIASVVREPAGGIDLTAGRCANTVVHVGDVLSPVAPAEEWSSLG